MKLLIVVFAKHRQYHIAKFNRLLGSLPQNRQEVYGEVTDSKHYHHCDQHLSRLAPRAQLTFGGGIGVDRGCSASASCQPYGAN